MAASKDLGLIVVAYIACLVAGAAILPLFDFGAIGNAFVADTVATIVIFLFSLKYKNSSFYDPYWSVIPPFLGLYWIMLEPAAVDSPRVWLVMALVTYWAIRLTANWTIHWGGLSHEDWRYPIVRERAGVFAIPADFLGIHMFPTLQVFLGCLPIYAVIQNPEGPLGLIDALAFTVTFGAVVIEMLADIQLHAFIRKKKPGEYINQGLWAWSRHPNYFGELAFWWGLMIFGLGVAPQDWWWIMPGALSMTIMFLFVSVPWMDKRSLERRPAYAEQMRRVSALIPLPPKP